MNDGKRFLITYSQGNALTSPAMQIWVDRQTGVNYLFTREGYGAGLTPLLDRDGKPLITPISPYQD